MKIGRDRGLFVKTGDSVFWLDSGSEGYGFSLITHAHRDHLPNNSSRVIATPETASILKLFRNRILEKTLGYGERLKLGDIEISSQPSGHVVGSSQFIIEEDGVRLVYTGDINTYDSLILRGAKPIEADILVIEATYGSPRYVFPRREEIYARIVRWIIEVIKSGEIPAFKVYALGKAQEIIGMINAYLDVPVITSWTISRINEKLSEHGLKLDYLPINSPEGLETFRGGECVYVSSRRSNPPSKHRIRWSVATGWALRYRINGYDKAFPLSGHADFPGLVSYIQESCAKKIYLVHGFVKEFSKHLRRMGFDARIL